MIRNYNNKTTYPYSCDFYIPEIDYFIEFQGSWVHGKHPYNPSSTEDAERLNKLQMKAAEVKSKT